MKKLIATFSALSIFGTLASLGLMKEVLASPTHIASADFIKIRCHRAGEPTWTHWSGQVTTSGINSDKPQTIFKMVGFNVARCYQDASGNWMVSSRELTYFLDPLSGEVIDTWNNPWTAEKVPVVHIANSLVQQRIPSEIKIPLETVGESALVRLDVPLSYPNPLAGDSRFADYSPENFYKAHESFTYVLSSRELSDISTTDSLHDVQVSWTRVSPWMPWMKMKGVAGYLVFNGIVKKVRRFEELPTIIQNEINQRLPLYLDAPKCIVAGRGNVTSWTYFKENFQAYLERVKFPLAAPQNQDQAECRN